MRPAADVRVWHETDLRSMSVPGGKAEDIRASISLLTQLGHPTAWTCAENCLRLGWQHRGD